MAIELSNTDALYVHIPFCDSICAYCDFCKVLSQTYNHFDYLHALNKELLQYEQHNFKTIYIGGGTPSSLTLEELKYLFELLKPYTSDVIEYSIEANPESLTLDKIAILSKYGINRVSLGVQTFNEDILKLIQRKHTKEDVFKCIDNLHHYGIDDINIDLISGLPNNPLTQTLKDIDLSDSLNISHISVYSLILEDHTIFKNNDYKPLDDESDALYYQTVNNYLTKLGYHHYEVSNYYKKKPSLHNLVYWHYDNYLAIGVGAHYKIDNHQYENTRSIDQYIKGQYLLNNELLSEDDISFNTLMMSLRLSSGVSVSKINLKKYEKSIKKNIDNGYMLIENDYLKLTYDGLMIMDYLLLDFL